MIDKEGARILANPATGKGVAGLARVQGAGMIDKEGARILANPATGKGVAGLARVQGAG